VQRDFLMVNDLLKGRHVPVVKSPPHPLKRNFREHWTTENETFLEVLPPARKFRLLTDKVRLTPAPFPVNA
jgi:hypothetical protein